MVIAKNSVFFGNRKKFCFFWNCNKFMMFLAILKIHAYFCNPRTQSSKLTLGVGIPITKNYAFFVGPKIHAFFASYVPGLQNHYFMIFIESHKFKPVLQDTLFW